jgi:hypothetical protein
MNHTCSFSHEIDALFIQYHTRSMLDHCCQYLYRNEQK